MLAVLLWIGGPAGAYRDNDLREVAARRHDCGLSYQCRVSGDKIQSSLVPRKVRSRPFAAAIESL